MGFLISLEGIEGSGKSLQASSTLKALTDKGYKVDLIKFPDKTGGIGAEISNALNGVDLNPETVQLLQAADKQRHQTTIKLMLEENDFVIVDRYTLSQLVYGVAQGMDERWMLNLQSKMMKPDLTIYLKVSFGESRRRVYQRRYVDSYEGNERLQRVVYSLYESYFNAGQLFKEFGNSTYEPIGGDFSVINGELEPEEVTEAIVNTICRRVQDE